MALPDYRRPRLAQGRRGRVALAAHLDALAAAVEREPVRVIVPPSPPSPYIGEAAFQRLITDLATLCAWEFVHNADSRWTQAGVPDLLLLGGPSGRGCHWWEIKTTRGKLRPEQLAFGQQLLRCGQDWRVIRPDSWTYVVETLTGVKLGER